MTTTTLLPEPRPATANRPEPGSSTVRLVSVDALRGFDMLWIVGAGGIVKALKEMTPNSTTELLATQLQHVQWEGLRSYDLIFPLFLFIVGVSMVFSLDKALASGGRAKVLARVFRRALLLYVLGVFYSGGLSQAWPEVRLGGALQRIAACYLFAALIYCYIPRPKGIVACCAALLVGYWALLTYVPFPDLVLDKQHVGAIAKRIGSTSPAAIAAAVPERVHGVYEEGRNLTNYLDFRFLPGAKAQTYYINEGLLSTLPAIALPLFGALAGLLLRNPNVGPHRKTMLLIAGGALGIALGSAWSLEFPIIKRIWTSSFVLVAGGLSAILLAMFYEVIDVLRWRNWCRPFVWIGANAIVIYLSRQIIGYDVVATRLAGGDIKRFFDTHVATGFGSLVIAILSLLLVILLARFLYKRNIFIRV